MSTFKVQVRAIDNIVAHPNADSIEFARIDGYQAIVGKGEFAPGQLVVYIPEAAIVPEYVLRTLGLWDDEKSKGKCTGSRGNRVRAIRLRGELSQGLVFPLQPFSRFEAHLLDASGQWHAVMVGQDVSDVLDITKYEPPIPPELAGEVFNAGYDLVPSFDIENVKSFPHILQEGEPVVITEKLHGTFTGLCLVPPEHAIQGHGRLLVFSKGLGYKGLAFKDNEANARNVYLRVVRELKLGEKLEEIARQLGVTDQPVFVLGETLGAGVQDLAYGGGLHFRAFDVGTGFRGMQRYLNVDNARAACESVGIASVPLLYDGPFSQAVLNAVTTGHETFSGKQKHMREGGVVRTKTERTAPGLGRVILKSVNPDYLVRKGHTTEYQ